jgi:uncharacterized protein (DUF924 family)
MDEVLTFWFADPTRAWRSDPAFDREIANRFATLRDDVLAGAHEDWCHSPRGALAYVIALDQFSRNLFRDTARMVEGDRKALAAAKQAVARGDDFNLSEVERSFLYMPFMHSEDRADQDRSVELFRERSPATLDYAERHRDVIVRFGRFPHRNAMLGRASTPDELAFLATGVRF